MASVCTQLIQPEFPRGLDYISRRETDQKNTNWLTTNWEYIHLRLNEQRINRA